MSRSLLYVPYHNTHDDHDYQHRTPKASMSYPSESELEDYVPLVGKSQRKSAAGRELIRWDPEKDQLALLCCDYVCTIEGVAIPWDKIAELMGGLVGKKSMTGEAIKQHLAKLHRFRDEAKQLVPPKLDRHQRRKPVNAARAEGTSAGPRGRKRARHDDDEEDVAPVTPVKPGKSLLYSKPETKSKRPPRTPATGRSGGRKSRDVDDFQREDEDDYNREPAPKRRATGATNGSSKRGRKPKSNARVEEDEQETAFPTPARTPKRLRPQPEVNYAEQAYEDEEERSVSPEHDVKQEQYHSPRRNNDYHQRPSHYAGNVLPSNDYSVHGNYTFGSNDNTSPHQSSPNNSNTPGNVNGGLPYNQQPPYQLQTPRSVTTPSDYGNTNGTFPQFGQGHFDQYPGFSFIGMPQFSMDNLGRAAGTILNSQQTQDSDQTFAGAEQGDDGQHDLTDMPAQYDYSQTFLPAYGSDAAPAAEHISVPHTPTANNIGGNNNNGNHFASSIEHEGIHPNYSFDSGIFGLNNGDDLKGLLDEPFGGLLNDQASFT